MYQGLIQEAEDSFTFEGLCSFMVEGPGGSSPTFVVAPGVHCPSILAGHVPGNQEAVVVGAALAALTVPGTTQVGLDTAPVDFWPKKIGGSLAPSAFVELRPGQCRQ